ncbi:major facilitator superfamily domain-containing protein [Suillus bovinus]|uniref:major facilitator superfamily domain-containing protein n=1 Tax=Suillus bovinus TaxID=48563 RepID=UPI001B86F48D|nr:major facilitator superfamily domain-containing protein [Suillus bovinus]KAG2156490.1 major facilitator superfamily domain-containing protein [Suillus bovinus]
MPTHPPSCSSCSDDASASSDRAHASDCASLDSRDEIQKVPNHSMSRLLFVHIGAAMTLFLATTDSTIVSTSLPTIVSELGASQSQYTWVGVAYMLTQTAGQPLYGRLSDLVGRKNVLYVSMMIFALGSLLCGAAKSIILLIVFRGLAGLGGGGIVSSVWVITSEIVEPQHRAKWSQALSITWSCSAIAGPILGGLFSSKCYGLVCHLPPFCAPISNCGSLVYMNLPVCLFAFLLLSLSLRNVTLGQAKHASWKNFTEKFDFIGLLLFMLGTCCLVIGFSFAMSNGWTSPSTLLLVTLGPVILACGGFYEVHTTREALFPPAVFKSLTVVIILTVTFLHNFAFTSGTFYLALYFQAVNGMTPLQAGVQMLPYSLGSSLASMPAAWFIGFCQRHKNDTSGQKWTIVSGLLISTLGFSLLITLKDASSHFAQISFPLIAGIGIGFLFHAPYQVFVKALHPSELATGTSAFFLVRFTGATIGLAVAGMVFDRRLSHALPVGYQIQGSSSINWRLLSLIEPLSLRNEVLGAVTLAIQNIWIVSAPLLGLAMVVCDFLQVML